MFKASKILFSSHLYFLPGAALAVDTTSDAYKTGNIAGKVIVAVIAILIMKKLIFGSK